MNISIYLAYSYEYNAGYIGKSRNLVTRFYAHCNGIDSCIRQFCDNRGVKVRGTFDMYEIIKCSPADVAYYEGHVYDLIEEHFQHIQLLNKNIPNRSNKEWVAAHSARVKYMKQNWRIANKEHLKDYNKQYWEKNKVLLRELHTKWCNAHKEHLKDYGKRYHATHKEARHAYFKQIRLNDPGRYNESSKRWRMNNPEYLKQWGMNNPDYHKEYKKRMRQRIQLKK